MAPSIHPNPMNDQPRDPRGDPHVQTRADAILAEHLNVKSRTATEVLVYLSETIGTEAIEELLDYIDLTGGTGEVRRRLGNIRAVRGGGQ